MLKIVVSVVSLSSMLILAALLNLTTPATAGPFGLLAIFIFAYLSSLGVMTYFLYFINRLISYLSSLFLTRRPYAALTFRRSYYYSTIVAIAPIMMVGLQSVGATGFYESILVLIFVVLGCLYVSKKVH